jgi:hypothetical protein
MKVGDDRRKRSEHSVLQTYYARHGQVCKKGATCSRLIRGELRRSCLELE